MFNYKIHIAQIEDIPIEDSGEFDNSGEFENLENSGDLENLENFEEIPNKVDNSDKLNRLMAQGAVDAAEKFEQIFNEFGFDMLGNILGANESQNILNDIINRTITKIGIGIGI